MPETQNTSGWLLWSVYELSDYNDDNIDHNDTSATRIVKILLKFSGKCPNLEFFLIRIFLYSDWIRRFTKRQSHKMIKHTQTLCRQIVWVCLTILWGWRFVDLRIQSKYRKIRTRKNSVFGHFSSSGYCRVQPKSE